MDNLIFIWNGSVSRREITGYSSFCKLIALWSYKSFFDGIWDYHGAQGVGYRIRL